jgi:thiamine transporter
MFQNLFDFFVATLVDEDGYVSYAPTTAGNIALFLLILLLFIAMAAFSGYKRKTRIKQLAFSAMGVTLAVVTSLFPLYKFPFGGSITLFSMFFICFVGHLYGAKAGIITGISYGFINLILGPYIIHPMQLLLDYPIAFGALGLAGIFSNSKYGLVKGYLLGILGRYIASSLSGYIFFASYAPEGWNPIVYTLVYNIGYIGPEVLLTVIFLVIPPVQNALKQVKQMAVEE